MRSGTPPRTVVVTGASSGIGLAAALQFAARGDQVVLVGRTQERLVAAVERVRDAGQEPVSFQADFERLNEVASLAHRLRERYPKIDVLVNNAGMHLGSYRRTQDGHEATIQANHLAAFLLSNLLHERLGGGRIVSVSVRPAPNARLDPGRLDPGEAGYNGVAAYQSSKVANVLFATAAAQRWPDVLSYSVHPGLVRTDIGRETRLRYFFRHMPFLATPEAAARRVVRLGTAPPSELTNGALHGAGAAYRLDTRRFAPERALEMWAASENAVKEYL
ncbi:SDR family NAD(P)-dependent oxidoreductase [Kineosporia succinea]|uniref:Daunorubicin C-13 ketoreductase n=1 Tax=Kineosporia succinea TaxID=84632 RepID=A0ABT9PAA2_9ACTN|nr:SDR family NAD(P)-dependent oxidoreductase [Kineosporia succinea]MDP9829618.1 daunorubicin C-13 ketoreductase [Kineosporia succinea]